MSFHILKLWKFVSVIVRNDNKLWHRPFSCLASLERGRGGMSFFNINTAFWKSCCCVFVNLSGVIGWCRLFLPLAGRYCQESFASFRSHTHGARTSLLERKKLSQMSMNTARHSSLYYQQPQKENQGFYVKIKTKSRKGNHYSQYRWGWRPSTKWW